MGSGGFGFHWFRVTLCQAVVVMSIRLWAACARTKSPVVGSFAGASPSVDWENDGSGLAHPGTALGFKEPNDNEVGSGRRTDHAPA